ncbi:unnamed protein product [Caretta caretta]
MQDPVRLHWWWWRQRGPAGPTVAVEMGWSLDQQQGGLHSQAGRAEAGSRCSALSAVVPGSGGEQGAEGSRLRAAENLC